MVWGGFIDVDFRGLRQDNESPGGHDAALVVCLVRRLARRKDGRQLNIVMHSTT